MIHHGAVLWKKRCVLQSTWNLDSKLVDTPIEVNQQVGKDDDDPLNNIKCIKGLSEKSLSKSY